MGGPNGASNVRVLEPTSNQARGCVISPQKCSCRLDFQGLTKAHQRLTQARMGYYTASRCSEPRPAPMRSFRIVNSSSLQPRALSGAVADLVSR
jgi:hypothetical protein